MFKNKIVNYILKIINRHYLKSSVQNENICEIKKVKVDNDSIRARLKAQGWNLLEIPIRKRNPDSGELQISRWKIVATKGERSYEVGGPTIDEALTSVGISLGVISKGQ